MWYRCSGYSVRSSSVEHHTFSLFRRWRSLYKNKFVENRRTTVRLHQNVLGSRRWLSSLQIHLGYERIRTSMFTVLQSSRSRRLINNGHPPDACDDGWRRSELKGDLHIFSSRKCDVQTWRTEDRCKRRSGFLFGLQSKVTWLDDSLDFFPLTSFRMTLIQNHETFEADTTSNIEDGALWAEEEIANRESNPCILVRVSIRVSASVSVCLSPCIPASLSASLFAFLRASACVYMLASACAFALASACLCRYGRPCGSVSVWLGASKTSAYVYFNVHM